MYLASILPRPLKAQSTFVMRKGGQFITLLCTYGVRTECMEQLPAGLNYIAEAARMQNRGAVAARDATTDDHSCANIPNYTTPWLVQGVPLLALEQWLAWKKFPIIPAGRQWIRWRFVQGPVYV